MEVTILSAQGLKKTSPTVFSSRLRPFIIVTIANGNGDKQYHVYKSRVHDDHGGATNPTWNDKFHVPAAFFANNTNARIYLQLFTKRIILGPTLLGWCQIPVYDIGFPSVGCVRILSYRLRGRDGSRSHGVVNLAIKLEPVVPVALDSFPVLGIPVICQNQSC